MDRKVRTVLINVAVYVGLIVTINVLSGFVLDNKVALYKRFVPETRPGLPVYTDKLRAYMISYVIPLICSIGADVRQYGLTMETTTRKCGAWSSLRNMATSPS